MPLLLFLLVLGLVAAALLVGVYDWGWLPAMLVPMVAFSLGIAINVVRVMVREIRAGGQAGISAAASLPGRDDEEGPEGEVGEGEKT